MAILYDSRGNEILENFPDQVGGGVMTDARTAVATLGALNAEVVMDLAGASVVIIDGRTAAGALTYNLEGTIDGTNYFGLPMFCHQQLLVAAIVQEQFVPSVIIATTHSGFYSANVSGFRRVRIRVSAYTSGNVNIALRATPARQMLYARPVPSNLHVTVTAAANTIATCTLPAPGVGMFHYITHINLMRNATAALAGSATLIHTSTNLPGTPAWSVGNAMVAGGTQLDLAYSPTTPLKSLVANTATTIVMPAAGAAVLNRINVSYYVGY